MLYQTMPVPSWFMTFIDHLIHNRPDKMNSKSARFVARKFRRRHLGRIELLSPVFHDDLDLTVSRRNGNRHLARLPLISMPDNIRQSLVNRQEDLLGRFLFPSCLAQDLSKFFSKRRKNLGRCRQIKSFFHSTPCWRSSRRTVRDENAFRDLSFAKHL